MTENKLEKMGFTQDGWNAFVAEIAANFGDGNLISHEYLKQKFGLSAIKLHDFDDVEEFIEALEEQQWAYMTCIDALRWELLKQEKMFMRNIRGEGYEILRPEDQVKFGYDEFVKDIKKAINEAGLIMNNVKPVNLEQQAKDNDMRSKFGIMKQMLEAIK